MRKASERQTAQEDLEDLDAQIKSAVAAGKASQALARELREKRKALQAVTGVKQKKGSNGPHGKDRVVNIDDVAESAELRFVCETIPLNPQTDEEKENITTTTSTPQRGGANEKHSTCLTLHVWTNITSTPQRGGMNREHDTSPALPIWNLSSFLDISPVLSPLKSPHRSRPDLFLPPPDFSSPILPRLQNCDLDPSLDPSFLPSLSYYGPSEMTSTDNEYN